MSIITPYQGAPPLAYEDSITTNKPTGLTRRQLLIGALIGTLGLSAETLRIDDAAGKIMDSAQPSSLVESPLSRRTLAAQRIVSVIFPGFNADPDRLSRLLTPQLSQYGDVWTVHYGTDMYPDNLAKALHAQLKKQYIIDDPTLRPHIVAYGHSMGGIVGHITAALLAERGYTIDALLLDNSPFSATDVRSEANQRMLALSAAAGRAGLHGGPLTRFICVTASHLADGESLKKSIQHGKDEAIPEEPYNFNRTNQIQAEIIFTAPPNLRVSAQKLIGVPTAYFRPQNPPGDKTVNGQTAFAGWRSVTKPHDILVPGGTHGIDYARRAEYYKLIAAFLSYAGVYTMAEQREHARQYSSEFGPLAFG